MEKFFQNFAQIFKGQLNLDTNVTLFEGFLISITQYFLYYYYPGN